MKKNKGKRSFKPLIIGAAAALSAATAWFIARRHLGLRRI